MSDIIEQLAAPTDQAVSSTETSADVGAPEGSDTSPEDKAMLLLDVVQAALMIALDGGISADSKSISFDLKDSGDIAVKGIDQDGVELEVVAGMQDLLDLLDEG